VEMVWRNNSRSVGNPYLIGIREGLPVTRAEFYGNRKIWKPKDNGHVTNDGHGRRHRCPSQGYAHCGVLFPANDAVNRLRSEVAARGQSEYQRYVRESDQVSSRYANC